MRLKFLVGYELNSKDYTDRLTDSPFDLSFKNHEMSSGFSSDQSHPLLI